MAFRELDWKFSRPVMIGDTIRVNLEVTETKPMPRLGGGTVTMKVTVLNQNNEVVNRGNWVMLVESEQ
jgi:acyl dehydratase